MKPIFRYALTAALPALALAATFNALAEDDLKVQADQAIANLKATDSSSTKLFDKAAAYVVLPSVSEGGFVIGASRGKGFLYEANKVTGNVTLTSVSIGAQVGGGTFSEFVFFETASAVATLKENKCEISAQAKATIAASGAAANAKFEQGVAVIVVPKSEAMVKAAVGGQKFKFEPVK